MFCWCGFQGTGTTFAPEVSRDKQISHISFISIYKTGFDVKQYSGKVKHDEAFVSECQLR